MAQSLPLENKPRLVRLLEAPKKNLLAKLREEHTWNDPLRCVGLGLKVEVLLDVYQRLQRFLCFFSHVTLNHLSIYGL